MESRSATPIFAELPEQSPEKLIPKKNSLIEQAKLSPTLAHFAQLKERFNPFQKMEELEEKRMESHADDLKVAYHEMGHVAVAEESGGQDISATVIPEGRARGLTRSVLRATMSIKDQLHARIRIALGGHAGEERGGQTDHSGTGSDMGQVQYFAEILSEHFYKRIYSAAEIISDEFSNARRIVFSCVNYDQRSLHLTEAQSI